MSRQIYDQLAEIYLKGRRTEGELVNALGIAYKTAKKAINRGWPEHKWAALKERAALYDRLHETASNRESPARAKEARDYLAMREEYLRIASSVRSALVGELGIILPAIPGSKAAVMKAMRQVHFVEELDDAGKVVKRTPKTLVVDVQVPASVMDLVAATTQIANALDRTGGGELEQILAKPPQAGTGRKKHNLTVEQLQFMAENGGRLPPGVRLEDLGDG